MGRLRGILRSRSPAPDSVAQGSRSSDALAAAKKVLNVARDSVDGLPIPGLKPVITIIGTVLDTVEKSNDNQAALESLRKQVDLLNSSILKPLSACTEVPPALKSAMDNLGEMMMMMNQVYIPREARDVR